MVEGCSVDQHKGYEQAQLGLLIVGRKLSLGLAPRPVRTSHRGTPLSFAPTLALRSRSNKYGRDQGFKDVQTLRQSAEQPVPPLAKSEEGSLLRRWQQLAV